MKIADGINDREMLAGGKGWGRQSDEQKTYYDIRFHGTHSFENAAHSLLCGNSCPLEKNSAAL